MGKLSTTIFCSAGSYASGILRCMPIVGFSLEGGAGRPPGTSGSAPSPTTCRPPALGCAGPRCLLPTFRPDQFGVGLAQHTTTLPFGAARPPSKSALTFSRRATGSAEREQSILCFSSLVASQGIQCDNHFLTDDNDLRQIHQHSIATAE